MRPCWLAIKGLMENMQMPRKNKKLTQWNIRPMFNFESATIAVKVFVNNKILVLKCEQNGPVPRKSNFQISIPFFMEQQFNLLSWNCASSTKIWFMNFFFCSVM